MAQSFLFSGALIVRDPRIKEDENDKFLDMLERYFSQPNEILLQDSRPELSYQVGFTPEGTELPRCASGRDEKCDEFVKAMELDNKPKSIDSPDPKMRFFWRYSYEHFMKHL